ncbi:hypothetical protein MP228_004156 [Amoeboaphelidium protococcarum]|nr:hypothetical protein MP228_004156 [Amoeboaphelidium protococcarum]
MLWWALFCLLLAVNAYYVDRIVSLGASSMDIAASAVDPYGNMLMAGYTYESSIQVYGVDGNVQTTITLPGSGQRGFVVKFFTNGTMYWHATMQGSVYVNYVGGDSSGNTVCYCQFFSQTQVYAASGSLVRSITSVTYLGGVFVISWSNAGSFQWVAQQTSAGYSSVTTAYVTSTGEIAFVLQAGASFAMTGSDNVQVSRSSTGSSMVLYATKLNSDGKVAWVAKMQNQNESTFTPQTSAISSVDGRVAVGAKVLCSSALQIFNLQDQIIKTYSMPYPGHTCTFVVVYNSSGSMQNTIYMYAFGYIPGVSGIAFDSMSNLYVKCTGGTPWLRILGVDGTGTQGTYEISLSSFVAKFSSTGSFQWLNTFSNPGTVYNGFDGLWISPSGLLSYTIGANAGNISVIDSSQTKFSVFPMVQSNGVALVIVDQNGLVQPSSLMPIFTSSQMRAVSSGFDSAGAPYASGFLSSSDTALFANSDGLKFYSRTYTDSKQVLIVKYLPGNLSTCIATSTFPFTGMTITISNTFSSITSNLPVMMSTALTTNALLATDLAQLSSSSQFSISSTSSTFSITMSLASEISHVSISQSVPTVAISMKTLSPSLSVTSSVRSSQALVQFSARSLGEFLSKSAGDESHSTLGVGAGTAASVQSLNLIAIVSSVLLSFALCFVIAAWLFTHRIRQNIHKSTQRPSTATQSYRETSVAQSTPLQDTNITSMPSVLNATTMMNSEYEIAVPAFLELKEGVNFRRIDGKVLSRGSQGVVALVEAFYLPTGHWITQNEFRSFVGKYAMQESSYEVFMQEVALLWRFRESEYVAKLAAFDKQSKILIMPLYELGALQRLIDGEMVINFTSDLVLQLCHDAVAGLNVLHQSSVVHNDIKLANYLMEQRDGKLRLCLTDFGVCTIVDSSKAVSGMEWNSVKGATISYAAPEVLQKLTVPQELWLKRDIYSVAIVMNEIVTRSKAWLYLSKQEVIDNVTRGMRPSSESQFLNETRCENLLKIVVAAWAQDPAMRPGASDLERLIKELM